MSATPEFTEAQLTAARKQAWHQAGEALLTLEDAKTWLSECGLVLFAPQPKAVAVAAPSLVEATLGAENAAPTAAETDTARGFVARMVADGSALPLNLLGGPGDVPDFIVSTQVFPYVFTLRGDKGWKQPPVTSGAVKVSPLALKVYETLAERGAMTAAELASELGRELTEPAILRGLVELWAQLRVIPLPQGGEGATLWELTTRRFTKAIKTGANAGQPTALSALISMYLVGVFAATEEEIATFLSPLTARSRVREALHGLTAGRQLETVVLDGKTLLYIPGALPEFAPAPEAQAAVEGEAVVVPDETAERPPRSEQPDERIRRFEGQRPTGGQRREFKPREFKPREFKPREGERQSRAGGARPGNREFRSRTGSSEGRQGGSGSARPAFGSRGGQAPRPGAGGFPGGKPERERRPFNSEGSGEGKPSYTRPWQEDRGTRPQRGPAGAQRGPVGGWKGSPRRAEGEGGGGAPERRPRPESGAPGGWSRKPAGGDRGRPQGDRPQRRSFGPRESGEGQGAGRPRERGGEGRPFAPRSFDRPTGGEGRGFRPPASGSSGRPREARSGSGNGPERRPPAAGAGFQGRGFNRGGDRPAFGDSKPQGKGPGFKGPGFKSAGFKSARPSFGGKPGAKSGGKPAFGKRSGPGGGKGSFGPKRNFGPKGSGGSRPDRPASPKPKPEAEE